MSYGTSKDDILGAISELQDQISNLESVVDGLEVPDEDELADLREKAEAYDRLADDLGGDLDDLRSKLERIEELETAVQDAYDAARDVV